MRFTPLRITLIYFVFALIWITTTDRIVEWFVDDVALLTQVQTAKGFFYIMVTAFALYWMVRLHEKSIQKKQDLQNEIYSAIPALITVYKPNLSEFSVNTEFEKKTGWKNSELSAVDIMEKVYPDSEYRKDVEEFMLNPNGRWKDFQLTTKSGKNIQTTWTNVRLSDETQIGIGFDITERKKIETKLRKNEEWLQLATTSAGVGLWEWNPQTGEVVIDKVWANLVGYSNQELEPISIETWNRLVHPDDLIKFEEEVQKYFNGKKPIYECEVRMRHKKGHWIWILDRGRIIEYDDEGKPVRLVGTHVDITHRKQVEQKLESEREFFRITSNLASDVIYNWDALKNTVIWSDGIHDVFGFSKEQMGDKLEFWESNIHPEDRDRVTTSLDVAMTSDDKIWVKEYRFLTSAGEIKYVRDKAFIFRDKNGNIYRMVGAIVDLTDEKKANEFLRYHANLLSEMSDAVISTDENYDIKIWNQAAEKIYGWQQHEVIGKPIDAILGGDIEEKKKQEIFQLLAEKGEWSGEIIQKSKEGNNLNILSSVRELKDKVDNITGLIIINRDISEQIRIDKEKRLLADLFIRSNTGLAVSNHKTGKLDRVNKAFADLFGYEMYEMIGMDMNSLYAEKLQQEPSKQIDILNKEGYHTFESELLKKGGSTFTALINLALVKERYGESEYRISTIQDISQLKKQQVELRKSRDRLLQAQQIAKLGYWSIDLENDEHWWSDIVYEIYQQVPDSFEPTLANYLSLVHPYDKKSVEESIKKNMDRKRFTLNHRILKSNQDTGYVQIRGERRFDEDLNREILSGTVLDITETKKIEKQLEDEQKRFEIAANITSDVIWEWNPAIGQLWWGEGMETVLGYKKEDYEGNPRFWHAKIAEEDRERVISSMEHAENSGALSWSENYLFHAADGSIRQIADSAMILRHENDEIYLVIGAMVDKTKEIEFQNALREQGHKFEMIAKSSNDVLYDRNFDTNEVWWSEGWKTRFDFKEEEIENSPDWWQQQIHPDERQRVTDNLNRAIKANDNSWSEYYKFKNGRGEYSVVVDKGFFIKNEDGNNYSIVGTISDITADIRAKEELKASEEQYRLLFEQSPLPMFIYDPNTLNFVTANISTIEKYGYSIKELRQMKIYDLHPESDHKAIKKEISENLKQKNTGFDVWPQVTKTGEKLIAEISGTKIFYEGKVLRLVIANDITEQKKAEERAISAIVEGEERERLRIAKELHDGLGQYLTASNMNLTSVYEDLENIPPNLSRAFETGLEFLNHAISETRNISQNLLPKAIQDFGLELAAESLVNHLSNSNEIEFHFYKNLGDAKIPDKIQINLYRILQEGLNNAIRHGKPKKIDVQLVYSVGEILLTIEDNGIAFNPKNMKNEGIGLRSMKTRAGAMSASFDILSSENRGTIISIVVPIQ